MSAPIRQDCQVMSFGAVAAQYECGSRSVLAMAHSHSAFSEKGIGFDWITHMDIHAL